MLGRIIYKIRIVCPACIHINKINPIAYSFSQQKLNTIIIIRIKAPASVRIPVKSVI